MGGTWDMIPMKDQAFSMCSGRPTSSSWNTADTKNTNTPAKSLGIPTVRDG